MIYGNTTYFPHARNMKYHLKIFKIIKLDILEINHSQFGNNFKFPLGFHIKFLTIPK